jgi:uncharacterized membrane protein YozB (DUF420 family)
MKAFAALILAIIVVSVSIIAPPALAYDEPSVGVKEGDWIEYDVSMTGSGAMPPTHDVRWFRIEVLPVQGTAFSVNLTARYANGTVGSAVWKFNFTEGNVGGWIIIPSNLGLGDTFYDYSIHKGIPVNVTIQSQEQKTVLGASRTVTYGNDSLRHKEWDKATGVFIGTTEVYKNVTTKTGWYIEDLTVTVKAIATNMWSPELILGLNPTAFYTLVAVSIVLAALILSLIIVLATEKKKMKKTASRSLSQGKIAVLTILLVVLGEVGFMTLFPFYAIGLSLAELNLIIQTFLTALVLVSMWFRMKGNYFVHEITMLIVMCVLVVGFSTVLLMGPFSGDSSQVLSSSPLRLVMNSLHAIFSIPAIIFGVWLVALWRPESTSFAAKSRRIAQLTTVFWVPSYVVGVLDFIVLHTTFFG